MEISCIRVCIWFELILKKNCYFFTSKLIMNEFFIHVAVTIDLIWMKMNEIYHNTNIMGNISLL